ncbi:type II toxin-antitoxin system RelB/DinJ family antitoxin [Sphingomonas sp. MMS24-J13]|uniref:type II toxin-antitoxin system RelB/DinJ family antitoxin n=1 Tax=Sphingomonas sp. MMS24-J13 TaxID=3238686 RepID=UPI00384CACF3
MPANALIQTRIDRDLKDRAAAVLDTMGLTVSDAVRILLTRIAHEGRLPFELAADREAYDAWFRAKVYEALMGDEQDGLSEQIEAAAGARGAAVAHKA